MIQLFMDGSRMECRMSVVDVDGGDRAGCNDSRSFRATIQCSVDKCFFKSAPNIIGAVIQMKRIECVHN